MKTLEQKLNETKNYLANASKHLFIVNDKIITKVITFSKDGNDYYAKLTINGDKIYITPMSTERMKWDVKYGLFPQYVKSKSIPYFKKMRDLTKLVENQLETVDFPLNRTTELTNTEIKTLFETFGIS